MAKEIEDMNEVLSNFLQLGIWYGSDKACKIFGVNYLIASIDVLDDFKGNDIFTQDFFEVSDFETSEKDIEDSESEEIADDFDVEYHGPTNLSVDFVYKSIIRLNNLLKPFVRIDNRLNEELLRRSEKDLEEKLLGLRLNGRVDWINRNGMYSFYVGFKEGYITPSEFGIRVVSFMEKYRSLISSKQA